MIQNEMFLIGEKDHVSENEIVLFSKIEVNHIGNVLRKRVGDKISLTDSKAYHYEVEINDVTKQHISCIILQRFEIKENKHKIILYNALLKGSQFDLQLEKSVELGVNGFHPLITDRVIANKNKVEKWADAIVKARKQCKQVADIPIQEPKKLMQVKKRENQLWLVPEIGLDQTDFSDINYKNHSEICIFIGPEGAFTEREISHLRDQGASFHSLGDLRLRAETAAWKAILTVQHFINL